MKDFKWTDLKGKDVLGGRKGGGAGNKMNEYILKKMELIHKQTSTSTRELILVPLLPFQREVETFTVELSQVQPLWKWKEKDML